MSRSIRSKNIVLSILLFEMMAFLLIFLAGSPKDFRVLGIGAGTMGLFVFQYTALTAYFPGCDRVSLLICNFLVGIGLIVQTRIGVALALRQLVFAGIGTLVLAVCIVCMRTMGFWRKMRWPFVGLSFALLAVAIVLGKAQFGASNWVTVFGVSIQPSEFVKVLMIFVVASLLDRDRTVGKLLLAGGYVAACLLLLLVQKDLGAVLLYAGTAVVLVYVATGNRWLLLGSLGAGAVGAVGAYQLFSHVRVRVALWQNPWAMYEGQGYQVVQGLIAIASGGLFGLGLTKGMPKAIPVAHSDYIFAVICEEFGLLFGLIMLCFYLVLIIRGALIALDARSSFDALVAIGCVSMISLQSFIIIAGVCKLIPLTGITLPFVSYGGSSMLSCHLLMGVLQGIAVNNHRADMREYGAVMRERRARAQDGRWQG